MTGFEPATLRPPGVYATGLRHIPNFELQIKQLIYYFQKETLLFSSTAGLKQSAGVSPKMPFFDGLLFTAL